MLFAAALSLLGSVIAIRMFKQMIAEKLFSEREMTKIGTACLCFQITLAVLLPRTYLALWCAIFSPLMICLCALTMLVRQRSQAFRESFRQTLALVSLKMKAGRSFRQSYSEVISESDPKWRGKHSDILNAVVFSQQRVSIGADLFVLEAIEELTRIDQQPHAAARRLQVYR
jgi:Flp pilus assembly protein TadB